MKTETNVFEREGRERKAQAIARFLWRQLPREDRTDERIPTGLLRMVQRDRDTIARAAGEQSPSAATWYRVSEIVRERVLDEQRWIGQTEEPRARAAS